MEIRITKKSFSIGSNARILYRIMQLLLIMNYTGRTNKKTVSLLKIHLLIWSLQSLNRKELLLTSKEDDYNLPIGIWEIDKNTNQALTYMYEDELCTINKKNYSLTDNGKLLVQRIIDDANIFSDEKDFLKNIGNTLTESNLNKLQKLWIN